MENRKEKTVPAPKAQETEHETETEQERVLSPTWATECIEDIDDWIESQGIYLRQ